MIWVYIWLGVVAIAMILEFITMDLVSIWFSVGGLVAMVLSGFEFIPWYVETIVFIVVSTAYFAKSTRSLVYSSQRVNYIFFLSLQMRRVQNVPVN